jgi:hypothetical protein
MAQSDTTPPTIAIVTPEEGASYEQGRPVTAAYSCADEVAPAPSCDGSVAGTPVVSGSAINTSTLGNYTFTIVAKDAAGNSTTATRHYSVVPVSGDVGGGTAATLNLTLGTPASFSPFIPGLAKDYSTTLTANITSTAGDASLSVADPSATATGRLVNGTFALVNALQVSGAPSPGQKVAVAVEPMGPVGSSAAPKKLLTYSGPLGLEPATLTFKQSITGTEPLRTGGYSKTLTFTLSTTQP